MSDAVIFVFGTCVFGIALAATMVVAIPPSQEDVKRRRMNESAELPDPSYTP